MCKRQTDQSSVYSENISIMKVLSEIWQHTADFYLVVLSYWFSKIATMFKKWAYYILFLLSLARIHSRKLPNESTASSKNLLLFFSVCFAVWKNHHMRTVTNYFIVNLSFADILVTITCLPASLVVDITETWFFGDTLCRILPYLQVSVWGKQLKQYWMNRINAPHKDLNKKANQRQLHKSIML